MNIQIPFYPNVVQDSNSIALQHAPSSLLPMLCLAILANASGNTLSFRSWKAWKVSSLGMIIFSQDCILWHCFSATPADVAASVRFALTRTRTSKRLVCTHTKFCFCVCCLL